MGMKRDPLLVTAVVGTIAQLLFAGLEIFGWGYWFVSTAAPKWIGYQELGELSSTLAILGRLKDRGLAVSGPAEAPPRTRPAPSAPAPPPRGRPRSRTGDRWPPGPASRAPAAAPRRGPPRAARGRPAR